MARRPALLMAGILLFAVAGCGDDGGGGDEDAFCDALDVLNEQVADGDLASDDGLEDATDTANDLNEAANSDQEDAVAEVGETLADADPDDAADTAEVVQDELGDFADDCDIDDFAEGPDVDDTTTTSDPDETTTTGGDETTTTGGGGGAGELNELAARDDVPADIEPEFADLAQACFDGDVGACDDMFFGSDDQGTGAAPDGSVARNYGSSCGGRIAQFAEGQPTRCVENIFLATAPDVASFTDPSFEDLAVACFNNDMQACVDLFQDTGVGTPEELYGQTCGFRVDPTITTTENCLDVFGPVAIG